MFRFADFKAAKESGEIIREIEVYPSKSVLFCGNGIFEFSDTKELDLIVNRELSKENWGGA